MNRPASIVTFAQFSQLLVASDLANPTQLERLHAAGLRDARQAAIWLISQGLLTKWQATQLVGGVHKLSRGSYRLLRELGRGTWGRVYLVEHARLRKRAAMKVLSSRWTGRPECVETFLSETRCNAELDHPNIILILDAGWDDNRCYVVMEYVAGVDLRQYVQKHGPVDFARVADWGYQVASACAYLHARGIAHGRIRPATLLINDHGCVKLLDAIRMPRECAGVEAGESDSVAAYAAPEQSAGRTATPQSDIFALGRTMTFLLTGRPPHAEPVEFPSRAAMDQDTPSPPIAFLEFIARMTSHDPALRPISMREIAKSLLAWCQTRWDCEPAAPPLVKHGTERATSTLQTPTAAARAKPLNP
jgi:serine/threonine-protein kinase